MDAKSAFRRSRRRHGQRASRDASPRERPARSSVSARRTALENMSRRFMHRSDLNASSTARTVAVPGECAAIAPPSRASISRRRRTRDGANPTHASERGATKVFASFRRGADTMRRTDASHAHTTRVECASRAGPVRPLPSDRLIGYRRCFIRDAVDATPHRARRRASTRVTMWGA